MHKYPMCIAYEVSPLIRIVYIKLTFTVFPIGVATREASEARIRHIRIDVTVTVSGSTILTSSLKQSIC